jgi:tRNA nucleotidyltransferase (CCA-adding enzyme)
VTGSVLGHQKTPFCGACMRPFMDWLHGHTRRRWHGMRFYDHASVPPEVDMSSLDNIPEKVLAVVENLKGSGHQAYLVGGCVRDLLRGRSPKDYDVATSATPQQVQGVFEKVIPTGIMHGTVTVIFGDELVEVTTFRSEGDYLDGRRPSSVSFETDIKADLSRRDFTMNAIAYDPTTRELVDPFDGQADLKAKVIRCVGDPDKRFAEDGLRPMRAIRFASTLGFQIEEKTLEACGRAKHTFVKVSAERIQGELARILVSDQASFGLQLLQSTGLMGAFLPELQGRCLVKPETVRADLDLRLAVALWPIPCGQRLFEDIVLRLKFPSETARNVDLWLRSIPALLALDGRSDSELRRFASEVGANNVRSTFQVLNVWQTSERDRLSERFSRILDANPPLSARELAVNGKEIMRVLGITSGPAVGKASRYLLNRVLDQPELNTTEALTAELRKWDAHAREGEVQDKGDA